MAVGGPPRASCDIRNRDKCWPAWEKYSKQYGTKLPTHSSETIARVLQGVNRAFVHQFHYGALWLEYLAMEFQRHGPPEAIPDSFMDDTSFAAKGWAVGSGRQVINIYIYIIYIIWCFYTVFTYRSIKKDEIYTDLHCAGIEEAFML